MLTGVFMLLLLGMPAASNEPASEDILPPLLQYRLDLSRDPRAFVQIMPEAISVFFRGLRVKTLPVEAFSRLGNGSLAKSRVQGRRPSPPEVMVRAAPEGKYAMTLAKIIQLGKMPSAYSVEFADGSRLYVTSDSSDWKVFQSVAEGRAARRLKRSGRDILFLRMKPERAKEFYWLLEQDTGVIY